MHTARGGSAYLARSSRNSAAFAGTVAGHVHVTTHGEQLHLHRLGLGDTGGSESGLRVKGRHFPVPYPYIPKKSKYDGPVASMNRPLKFVAIALSDFGGIGRRGCEFLVLDCPSHQAALRGSSSPECGVTRRS
jgi:hypothetical protein